MRIINTSIHINSDKDLSRPSWPPSIYMIIPDLIAEYQIVESNLLKLYPWIREDNTMKLYSENEINYSDDSGMILSFETINLGIYNTQSSKWSWSWIDKNNKLIRDDSSNEFREYGNSKIVELMIKAHWNASLSEIEELLAVCIKLKSAIGVDVRTVNNYQHYRLLLDLVRT